MQFPARWKQSRWLKWLKPVKRWWYPPPLPPPVLAPSVLTGIVPPLPSVPAWLPAERASLFQSITSRDLSNQIGAADVALRIVQIFKYLSYEVPDFPGQLPRLRRDPLALERAWDCWHAVVWYAWRFRPGTFLELGGGIGQTAAMVALNSPRTALVCFDMARERKVGLEYYFPTFMMHELGRCGFGGPITFVSGNSHRTVPYYFSGTSLRSRRRDQLRACEFDLVFVNGTRQRSGIYRDLKNVFAYCALGGMVVLKLTDRQADQNSSPPRLLGLWDRLQRRFGGFRFFTARESEVGLAFRVC